MQRVKFISLALVIVFLSQSCIVYQKTSVSLDEAIDKGNVQVVTKAGKEVAFKKIIIDDNVYYGVNRKSAVANVQLNSESISSVFLKNKGKSTLATVLLITPFVGLLIFSMANSDGIF